MSVRTRFAPSPTGYLHVGGLRTALYNYLFARKSNGVFILRVEDTDRTRFVQGAMENLIETLKWAGINFDEGPHKGGPYGPYIQSERTHIYREYAEQLLQNGHAYKCFCTSERLDEMRMLQQRMGQPPRYDKFCEHLSSDEVKSKEEAKLPFVIRMKVPDQKVRILDVIRGAIEIEPENIDSQVLIKSDGFPTYHLANVVDDHLMQITHVIRGEEWLPSTPKHILLYEYFGWELPVFAHLPLLLNADRSKLSKRQGDVAVEDYQKKNYIPDALLNFVAFLGWNPGDERELFSLTELEKAFTLDRVGKAGAVFDVQKLNWYNQQYIRQSPIEGLTADFMKILESNGIPTNSDYDRKVVEILLDRVTFIHDFWEHGRLFYQNPESYDPDAVEKKWSEGTSELLSLLSLELEQLPNFDAETIKDSIEAFASGKNIKSGKLMLPLRLAVSGETQGPSLMETLSILGKETVILRIKAAAQTINK